MKENQLINRDGEFVYLKIPDITKFNHEGKKIKCKIIKTANQTLKKINHEKVVINYYSDYYYKLIRNDSKEITEIYYKEFPKLFTEIEIENKHLLFILAKENKFLNKYIEEEYILNNISFIKYKSNETNLKGFFIKIEDLNNQDSTIEFFLNEKNEKKFRLITINDLFRFLEVNKIKHNKEDILNC